MRDPLTGRPVFLITETAAAEFLQGHRKELCRPLACRPLGGEEVLLDAFDPEGIWLNCPAEHPGAAARSKGGPAEQKEEERVWKPAAGVLAIAPGPLPAGCDVLLPPEAASEECDEGIRSHRLFAMYGKGCIAKERCD